MTTDTTARKLLSKYDTNLRSPTVTYGNLHEPTVTDTCSAEEWYFPSSNNVINCNKCDMKIHFICTKIPAYYLMNLISEQNYICERCTGKTQDVIEPCFDTVFHELKVNYDNANSQIVELNRAHEAEREKFHKRIAEITTYYDVNADDNEKSFMNTTKGSHIWYTCNR